MIDSVVIESGKMSSQGIQACTKSSVSTGSEGFLLQALPVLSAHTCVAGQHLGLLWLP